MITFKSEADVKAMRRSGRVVADVLKMLKDLIKPGINTLSLDTAVAALLYKEEAKAAFKGYKLSKSGKPFPACICTSVNEEVVHGIPSSQKILEEGDILSVDVGVLMGGYHGDAACTYAVGQISAQRRKLLDVTLAGLHKAIAAVKAGATLGDVGYAVQSVAAPHGYGLVRDYAGHGIGRGLHEPPQVPNFGSPGKGITLKAGMTICIEPMVVTGKEDVKSLKDGWTVVTVDKSDAAHFEHTVLVTRSDCEVLTPWET